MTGIAGCEKRLASKEEREFLYQTGALKQKKPGIKLITLGGLLKAAKTIRKSEHIRHALLQLPNLAPHKASEQEQQEDEQHPMGKLSAHAMRIPENQVQGRFFQSPKIFSATLLFQCCLAPLAPVFHGGPGGPCPSCWPRL